MNEWNSWQLLPLSFRTVLSLVLFLPCWPPLLSFFEGSSFSAFHVDVVVNLVPCAGSGSPHMGLDAPQHSVLGPQVLRDTVHLASLSYSPQCTCWLYTGVRWSFIPLGKTGRVPPCARPRAVAALGYTAWVLGIRTEIELCLFITWLFIYKAKWRNWR